MKIKHKLTKTDHGQPGAATSSVLTSTALPLPADVPSRIRSAVLAAYAATPDDWDRAAASMLASIRDDSDVCAEGLRRWCHYEVRMIASEKRGEYGKRPEPGHDKALLGLQAIRVMEGMTMTETERVLREQFPEDRDRITFIFNECERAARAIDEARAEDIRRAAEGRRVRG